MRAHAGAASSSLTYRHPVQPSSANSASPPGSARPASPRSVVRVAGRISPPHHAIVIHVVERDLLPMHVKPAYHRHWDLLKLPKNI